MLTSPTFACFVPVWLHPSCYRGSWGMRDNLIRANPLCFAGSGASCRVLCIYSPNRCCADSEVAQSGRAAFSPWWHGEGAMKALRVGGKRNVGIYGLYHIYISALSSPGLWRDKPMVDTGDFTQSTQIQAPKSIIPDTQCYPCQIEWIPN